VQKENSNVGRRLFRRKRDEVKELKTNDHFMLDPEEVHNELKLSVYWDSWCCVPSDLDMQATPVKLTKDAFEKVNNGNESSRKGIIRSEDDICGEDGEDITVKLDQVVDEVEMIFFTLHNVSLCLPGINFFCTNFWTLGDFTVKIDGSSNKEVFTIAKFEPNSMSTCTKLTSNTLMIGALKKTELGSEGKPNWEFIAIGEPYPIVGPCCMAFTGDCCLNLEDLEKHYKNWDKKPYPTVESVAAEVDVNKIDINMKR